MAKCPHVVRINGSRWTLHTTAKAWEQYGDVGNLGVTNALSRTIAVAPHCSGLEEEACTVLHEVLHAVWWLAFTNPEKKRNQEDCVGGIEHTLYSVLRDNPKLLAYLQKPEALG